MTEASIATTVSPFVPEAPAPVDFFGGVTETQRWYFPGQDENNPSAQYIEFSIMNEGQRKRFQKKTSRDLKVDRKTNTAAIGVDIAGDRQELLLSVVVGWHMINGKTGEEVPFDKQLPPKPGGTFDQWMNRADPRLIDKLERAVRDANPWMQDEFDSASIREEIERLEKLYDEAVQRENEKENF